MLLIDDTPGPDCAPKPAASPDLAGQGRAQPASLDAVEALNALAAERFRALDEDIPLWRFRDVLMRLGTRLGLSSGAVLYAIDLLGLLSEADWRGDGRAVTYHSIRLYARKVGKSERTICTYERQLIAAGLAHRTLKHGRRHGGRGASERRTGLDWRAFGARMPALLIELEAREREEDQRKTLEAELRGARQRVLGLMEGLRVEAGQGASTVFMARYAAIDVARLRGTLELGVLTAKLEALNSLQAALAAVLEGSPPEERSNQSEDLSAQINTTTHPSCPSDIRKTHVEKTAHRNTTPHTESAQSLEDRVGASGNQRRFNNIKGRAGQPCAAAFEGAVPSDPGKDEDRLKRIPIDTIWHAAPEAWQIALGAEIEISWPVLFEIADHIAPRLGVSPNAWARARRVMGQGRAALALFVLDANRMHPKTPVISVGGALVGMIRKAEADALHLAPSLYGVIERDRQSRSSARHGCSAHRYLADQGNA